MALPENRQSVQELLKELEPRILGFESEGWSCGCGDIHCGTAVADKIKPAGDNYPGQETLWSFWSVHMKAQGEGSNWSCGLSKFIDPEELSQMFKRHFGDQKDEYPYRLDIDGENRVYDDLPAAVRIQENDNQIRFSFSWGREQDVAARINELVRTGSRRKPADSEVFTSIVSILEAIRPETYRGGPNPELSHESSWHLDYDTSLGHARTVANHIFFQNGGRFMDHRGTVFTKVDVVFMKHAVK